MVPLKCLAFLTLLFFLGGCATQKSPALPIKDVGPDAFTKDMSPGGKLFYDKVERFQPGSTKEETDRFMGTKGTLVPNKEKRSYGRDTETTSEPQNTVHSDPQYRWEDTKTKSYIIVEFSKDSSQVLEAGYF